MQTTLLQILGLSEATLTMILDNLESTEVFPAIRVLNNLNMTPAIAYASKAFDIRLETELPVTENHGDAFLGVYKPVPKQLVYALFGHISYNWLNIIHRQTSISSCAELGKGSLINSFVSIAAYASIGDFVSINRNASIGHHTLIEDFVTVNPGATIAGNVTIGKGSTIGMGVNIIDNIRIGKNTIIGAGSLVTRDLPDNVVAYGNPCRIIKDNKSTG